MKISVGELFYGLDRFSKIYSETKEDPDLVIKIEDMLQDLKNSFKEAGECYEDYCDDEIELSIEKIMDMVEEVIKKKIEA